MLADRLARLLASDYAEPESLQTLKRLTIGRIACRIVEVAIGDTVALLITGTQQRQQWARFNLRFRPDFTAGDSGRLWHAGFFSYGQVAYAFAAGWLGAGGRIDYVAGHSLGAAAAQIVGSSLGIQTFGYASPKPLWSRTQPPGALAVTNYCAPDDWVTRMPPWGHRVGQTICLESPARLSPRKAHGIGRYCELLRDLATGTQASPSS